MRPQFSDASPWARVEPELLVENDAFASSDRLLIAFWSFEASLTEALAVDRRRRGHSLFDAHPAEGVTWVEALHVGKTFFAAPLSAGGCVVRQLDHAGAHLCLDDLSLRAQRNDSGEPNLVRAGILYRRRTTTAREAWAEASCDGATVMAPERDADWSALRELRRTLLRPLQIRKST